MRHALHIIRNRMGDLEITIASQALAARLTPQTYDDGITIKRGAYLQGQAADDFIKLDLSARARQSLNAIHPTTAWVYDEIVYCLFCVSY